MLCPCCKSELAHTGEARLETLIEHVECCFPAFKPKYECLNKNCRAFKNACWNEDGEYYIEKGGVVVKDFIDNNNAPFGSIFRQINVECDKKDENKRINLLFVMVEIRYKYTSNQNGDILSRKKEIVIWKKKKNHYEYWFTIKR
jgi:hypothetical protein